MPLYVVKMFMDGYLSTEEEIEHGKELLESLDSAGVTIRVLSAHLDEESAKVDKTDDLPH